MEASEFYTLTSMQYMSAEGRRRCCEVAVSGAHRRSGYVFTNYHLFVLHANTLRYIVLQICITQNTGELSFMVFIVYPFNLDWQQLFCTLLNLFVSNNQQNNKKIYAFR